MQNIIFENKTEKEIKGLYYGQPYKIDFSSKKDLLQVLTEDEVMEVLNLFNVEVLKPNSMLSISNNSKVAVVVIEGGELFEYNLKVSSIDEQGYDDEGNYYCVAYGEPLNEEDKSFAEEFTSRIDNLNFKSVLM